MNKILTILFISILIGSSVQAQTTGGTNNPTGNNPLPQYNLLEPIPCIPGGNVTCATPGATETSVNFKYYVQYMFNLLIALAAVASVFMIVWGGLQYMSTDSWNGKKEGLDKLKNAVLGLILVLTSYLILQVIDPRLVQIPTTLVPALNIKYEKANDQLFKSLSDQAARFDQNIQEARKLLAEGEVRNTERQQTVYDLEEERETLLTSGFSESDPEIQEIDAKINGLLTAITDEKSGAILLIAKRELDSKVVSIRPDQGTGPNWALLKSEIERIYIQRPAQLQAAAAPANQVQELTKYKEYSKQIVNINSFAAKPVEVLNSSLSSSQIQLRLDLERKNALAEIDKIVSTYSAAVSGTNQLDVNLYSQLVKHAGKVKAELNALIVK